MKIGIICDYVEKIKVGKTEDIIADQEAYLTAKAIKEVLEKKNFKAEIVKIDLKKIPGLKKYDFVFNLAEGLQGVASGELRVAESLEKNKIKFTGSGSKVLALCLDKAKTKKVLVKNKIKTPAFQVFEKADEALKLKFPLFVKPLHEDAGIGIDISSLVYDKEKLRKKVREILTVYKQPALVEEFIDGQELSVSIIGNGRKLWVLPIAEFVFNYPSGHPKIRTYESKWIEDSEDFKNLGHRIPAKVKPAAARKIKSLALKAYRAIGCRDYARVDFRMRGDEPFVLEMNPNPCLFPVDGTLILSGKAAGYSYDEIIMKILEAAAERHRLTIPK